MPRTVVVHQVDAFTAQPLEGNPAGVVLEASGLSDREMQLIARELSNSETAFVLPPDGPDHDVRIRFFTPTTEVPSCGHATVAAHYLRAVTLRLESTRVRQRIGIGTLPVDIVRDNGDYRVVMTQGPPTLSPPLDTLERASVLCALGIVEADVDPRCPVQLVSTGHSKIMIGVRTREILNALRPAPSALERASASVPNRGFFVFTLDSSDPDITTHARMFAPHIGIPEDPVTGNGNGPLGAYLVRHQLLPVSCPTVTFRAAQGEAIGRPGVVDVAVDVMDGRPVAVRVAGRAVIVFEAELLLP